MKLLLLGLGVGAGWAFVAGSSMDRPSSGAILLGAVLAVFLGYRLGRRRGHASAFASAQATAVAQASAASESTSNASVDNRLQVNVFVPPQVEVDQVERRTQEVSPQYRPTLEALAVSPDLDPEEVFSQLREHGSEALADQLENG